MKKILMGSLVLTVFSLSIVAIQFSCSKTATAQTTPYTLPAATNSTLGGVIVGSGLSVSSSGVLSSNATSGLTQKGILLYSKLTGSGLVNGEYGNFSYWTCNYDGSNSSQIQIQLPSNITGVCPNPKLSPDGQTLFFSAITGNTSGTCYVYSCSINGSNLKQIMQTPQQNPGGGQIEIGGAY